MVHHRRYTACMGDACVESHNPGLGVARVRHRQQYKDGNKVQCMAEHTNGDCRIFSLHLLHPVYTEENIQLPFSCGVH